MPNKFARQPRPLELLDRWKTTEFKQFLLYPGPVVLKNILTESKYKHFFLSIVHVYSLESDSAQRNEYIDYAQSLLKYAQSLLNNL